MNNDEFFAMNADDILFEPIGPSKSTIILDQEMIDAVKIALTGTSAIEFVVDYTTSLETYDKIADLIEDDPQIIKYTNQMVNPISATEKRPVGALTLKELFERMYNGNEEFYFCARGNGQGVQKHKFTNWFGIDSQIPMIHVDSSTGAGGFFEMWIMGLMSKNIGYNQYYCFSTWADASKYYGVP